MRASQSQLIARHPSFPPPLAKTPSQVSQAAYPVIFTLKKKRKRKEAFLKLVSYYDERYKLKMWRQANLSVICLLQQKRLS